MKAFLKIVVLLFFIALIVFAGLALWVKFSGKAFVEKQISQNSKMQTTIQKISLAVPLRVTIEGLQVGDLARVQTIACSPNLLALVAGKIVLDGLTIIKPEITLRQSQDGSLNIPVFEQKGKPPQIFVNGLTVKEGKVTYTDYKVDPAGFVITVDAIKADVSRISFPFTQLKTDVSASAEFFGKSDEKIGSFNVQGWFNLLSKDLNMTIRSNDVQVTYFAPYYGDFLSKRKLTSVKLGLVNTCTAVHNELEIVSDLKLSDFVYAPDQSAESNPEGRQLNMFTDALDIFRDAKGDLSLRFVIHTKLDKPAVSIEEIKKAVFAAALKNLQSQPPEQVIQKVVDTVSKFKAFGKEMKKMFQSGQEEQDAQGASAQEVGDETK